jgi:hypothetical protein
MKCGVAFLLELAVVHQCALAGDDFRDGVRERGVCRKAEEGFDDRRLRGVTHENQATGMRQGGPAAPVGNLQDVQGLLQYRPLGHFDEYAVFKKRRIERHKSVRPRVRIAPEMTVQKGPMVLEGRSQAARLEPRGDFAQFREFRHVAPVEERQAAAPEVGQRQALDLAPDFLAHLHVGGHEGHGHQGRDARVLPLFAVRRREPQLREAFDGRAAQLAKPGGSMLIEDILKMRKACEVKSFLFLNEGHEIPVPLELSRRAALQAAEKLVGAVILRSRR